MEGELFFFYCCKFSTMLYPFTVFCSGADLITLPIRRNHFSVDTSVRSEALWPRPFELFFNTSNLGPIFFSLPTRDRSWASLPPPPFIRYQGLFSIEKSISIFFLKGRGLHWTLARPLWNQSSMLEDLIRTLVCPTVFLSVHYYASTFSSFPSYLFLSLLLHFFFQQPELCGAHILAFLFFIMIFLKGEKYL